MLFNLYTTCKTSHGAAGSLSFGYHFTENFAAELALNGYFSIFTKEMEQDKRSSIFTSCYYNFTPNSTFSPYVKVGAGYQFFQRRLIDTTDSRWNVNSPAAAVGIGGVFNLSHNIFLDIGYTFYMSMKSKIEFADTQAKASLNAHNVTIGIGLRSRLLKVNSASARKST